MHDDVFINSLELLFIVSEVERVVVAPSVVANDPRGNQTNRNEGHPVQVVQEATPGAPLNLQKLNTACKANFDVSSKQEGD